MMREMLPELDWRKRSVPVMLPIPESEPPLSVRVESEVKEASEEALTAAPRMMVPPAPVAVRWTVSPEMVPLFVRVVPAPLA